LSKRSVISQTDEPVVESPLKLEVSFGAQAWAGLGLKKQAEIEFGVKIFAYNIDLVSGEDIWTQDIGASLNIKNARFLAAGFAQEGEGSLSSGAEWYGKSPISFPYAQAWDSDVVIGISGALFIGINIEYNVSQHLRNIEAGRAKINSWLRNYDPPRLPENLPPPY